MTKIRKAVIPEVGFGTWCLPRKKVITKEMKPVNDKLTIKYILNE